MFLSLPPTSQTTSPIESLALSLAISTLNDMPATRRRNPLSELPLSSYVVTDKGEEREATSSSLKSPLNAKLLSPPKRRILAAEGLASPSKSPARRLIFQSMESDVAPFNSLSELLTGGASNDSSRQTIATSDLPISSTSSLTSVSTSTTVISSQTASVHSHSKLSISTTSVIRTPPATRARTRSLAPSPELPDTPVAREGSPDVLPPTRPTSLKRLRSAGSTSSSSSSASARPPTPKRRIVTFDLSPVVPFLDEADEDPENDKENVPPPKKKKVMGIVKAPREGSLTPRSTKQRSGGSELPTPEVMRIRRAALEAEVNYPDMDDEN